MCLSVAEDQMLWGGGGVRDELLNSAFGHLTKELPVVFLVSECSPFTQPWAVISN